MMNKWYIEGLDALGGFAFASWRAAGSEPYDPPTVSIGPPSFVPEQIASRAIALAATRGAFQRGLFFGTKEYGFDTPTEVAELVRRLFVGGSGGAGPGGGNLPPPEPPPEQPRGDVRETSPEPQEPSGAGPASALSTATGAFAKTVSSLFEEQTQLFRWTSHLAATGTHEDYAATLLRAAESLARELAKKYSPTFRWTAAAKGLFSVLDALGVDGDDFLARSSFRDLLRLMDFQSLIGRSPCDSMYDRLSLLPIAPSIGAVFHLDRDACTLTGLLATATAAPRVLANPTNGAALELVVFAASALVASADRRRATPWGMFLDRRFYEYYPYDLRRWLYHEYDIPPFTSPAVSADGFAELWSQTRAWLAASLPQLAFYDLIEGQIDLAPQLRYA